MPQGYSQNIEKEVLAPGGFESFDASGGLVSAGIFQVSLIHVSANLNHLHCYVAKLPPLHPGEVLREEFLVPMKFRPMRWQRRVESRVRASNALRARNWASPPIPPCGSIVILESNRSFGLTSRTATTLRPPGSQSS